VVSAHGNLPALSSISALFVPPQLKTPAKSGLLPSVKLPPPTLNIRTTPQRVLSSKKNKKKQRRPRSLSTGSSTVAPGVIQIEINPRSKTTEKKERKRSKTSQTPKADKNQRRSQTSPRRKNTQKKKRTFNEETIFPYWNNPSFGFSATGKIGRAHV